jgi:hypothetical protein
VADCHIKRQPFANGEPREQDKAGTGANYWPEIQGGV